jgi:hypothetical protein
MMMQQQQRLPVSNIVCLPGMNEYTRRWLAARLPTRVGEVSCLMLICSEERTDEQGSKGKL